MPVRRQRPHPPRRRVFFPGWCWGVFRFGHRCQRLPKDQRPRPPYRCFGLSPAILGPSVICGSDLANFSTPPDSTPHMVRGRRAEFQCALPQQRVGHTRPNAHHRTRGHGQKVVSTPRWTWNGRRGPIQPDLPEHPSLRRNKRSHQSRPLIPTSTTRGTPGPPEHCSPERRHLHGHRCHANGCVHTAAFEVLPPPDLYEVPSGCHEDCYAQLVCAPKAMPPTSGTKTTPVTGATTCFRQRHGPVLGRGHRPERRTSNSEILISPLTAPAISSPHRGHPKMTPAASSSLSTTTARAASTNWTSTPMQSPPVLPLERFHLRQRRAADLQLEYTGCGPDGIIQDAVRICFTGSEGTYAGVHTVGWEWSIRMKMPDAPENSPDTNPTPQNALHSSAPTTCIKSAQTVRWLLRPERPPQRSPEWWLLL